MLMQPVELFIVASCVGCCHVSANPLGNALLSRTAGSYWSGGAAVMPNFHCVDTAAHLLLWLHPGPPTECSRASEHQDLPLKHPALQSHTYISDGTVYLDPGVRIGVVTVWDKQLVLSMQGLFNTSKLSFPWLCWPCAGGPSHVNMHGPWAAATTVHSCLPGQWLVA